MSIGHDPVQTPLPHQPGVLFVHLLNRCNLFCQHCYLEAAPWEDTSLPVELVIRSVREVDRLGINRIYLTGGEPFLYPGLPDVIAAVCELPGVELYVATNGTLIGDAEVEMMKDAGANVQISIDGPEMCHDQIRGAKGAFKRARDGIGRLVSAGVPVAVVTTICRANRESLPWLAEWASELGVDRISVQPLLALGRGAEMQDSKLSDDQMCDLMAQLSDLGHAYRPRGLRFSLAYRTRQYLRLHPCAAYVCKGTGCHRKVEKEIKKLVIREDGTVLPEIPTLNHHFALGNLRDGTLVDLVASYFANGYKQFDRLCRSTYDEVMPTWSSPIVPWDEIVSERSRTVRV